MAVYTNRPCQEGFATCGMLIHQEAACCHMRRLPPAHCAAWSRPERSVTQIASAGSLLRVWHIVPVSEVAQVHEDAYVTNSKGEPGSASSRPGVGYPAQQHEKMLPASPGEAKQRRYYIVCSRCYHAFPTDNSPYHPKSTAGAIFNHPCGHLISSDARSIKVTTICISCTPSARTDQALLFSVMKALPCIARCWVRLQLPDHSTNRDQAVTKQSANTVGMMQTYKHARAHCDDMQQPLNWQCVSTVTMAALNALDNHGEACMQCNATLRYAVTQ